MASEAKLKLVLLLVRGKAYLGGSVFFMGNNIVSKLGVIPYRESGDGCFDILIVTTLRGKWALPKGNLIKRLGPTRTAQLEAYEEAGISGKIIDQPFSFQRQKKEFTYYPFKVCKVFKDWPESSLRTRRWISLEDAEDYIHRKPILRILKTATEKLL